MDDAEFVKSSRRALRLSQNQLAALLGKKSDRTIRKWEEGGEVQRADLIAIAYLVANIDTYSEDEKTVDRYEADIEFLFNWVENSFA